MSRTLSYPTVSTTIVATAGLMLGHTRIAEFLPSVLEQERDGLEVRPIVQCRALTVVRQLNETSVADGSIAIRIIISRESYGECARGCEESKQESPGSFERQHGWYIEQNLGLEWHF